MSYWYFVIADIGSSVNTGTSPIQCSLNQTGVTVSGGAVVATTALSGPVYTFQTIDRNRSQCQYTCSSRHCTEYTRLH
jgi:hypothetical protein